MLIHPLLPSDPLQTEVGRPLTPLHLPPTSILVDFYHIIVCSSSARLKALSRWDFVCLGLPIPGVVPGKKKVLNKYGGLRYGDQRQKCVGKEGSVK